MSDNLVVIHKIGDPTPDVGNAGDYYVNIRTGTIYQKRENIWVNVFEDNQTLSYRKFLFMLFIVGILLYLDYGYLISLFMGLFIYII